MKKYGARKLGSKMETNQSLQAQDPCLHSVPAGSLSLLFLLLTEQCRPSYHAMKIHNDDDKEEESVIYVAKDQDDEARNESEKSRAIKTRDRKENFSPLRLAIPIAVNTITKKEGLCPRSSTPVSHPSMHP